MPIRPAWPTFCELVRTALHICHLGTRSLSFTALTQDCRLLLPILLSASRWSACPSISLCSILASQCSICSGHLRQCRTHRNSKCSMKRSNKFSFHLSISSFSCLSCSSLGFSSPLISCRQFSLLISGLTSDCREQHIKISPAL